MQLPYGIADFAAIRTDGYQYVDRTGYIAELERLGRVLVFLRPRRFGKSLWLDTLRCYYDVRVADRFDALFGDLEVGRSPTPLHNRFFVLVWDFSGVGARGTTDEVGRRLNDYVNSRIKDFLTIHRPQLPAAVEIEPSAGNTLGHLLTAIRQSPHKLYLLIDEYDNFINEVMVRDAAVYRDLVDADGPFKELFKAVKSAMRGEGLERVFVTGVSPVPLNDLTSGFNIAKDVSLSPRLAGLCGFREDELRALLAQIGDERGLSRDVTDAALDTMRTWYNGYRFTDAAPRSQSELVYNPTSALYFLESLDQDRRPPRRLHDDNLRSDRGKLAFLARTAAGAGVIEDLAEGDGAIAIAELERSFGLEDLTARMAKDRGAVASFLYYMGLVTLTEDVPPRLRIPNLVVRRLMLDRLLEIHLPDLGDSSAGRELAFAFLQSGELAPLLRFFESKLLPVLSNRDRGAAPRRPGLGGSGVDEVVLKALFLSLLFDDQRYVTFSESELDHGYADLCLLVRPEMREHRFFDLLLELKLVRRNELGKAAVELAGLDEAALRKLPPVQAALDAARQQAERYRAALVERFGADNLSLRVDTVVAVGLERMLSDEIGST